MIKNFINKGGFVLVFFILMLVGLAFEKCAYGEIISIEKEELVALVKSAEEGTQALNILKKIIESTPKVDIESIEIVIDKNGAVFVKDKISGKLLLFDKSLSNDIKQLLGIDKIEDKLIIKLNVVINKVEEKDSIFRLRIKAAYLIHYEDKFKESGGVLIEPMHYKDLNLNATIGSKFFGLAVGYDITKNFNFFVGVGLGYKTIGSYKPFAGLAFSF